MLFFDELQRKGLAKSEGTQIEVICDTEKQQPDAILLITQPVNKHGREQEHCAHVCSQKCVAAAQMQNKPPVAGQLPLYF